MTVILIKIKLKSPKIFIRRDEYFKYRKTATIVSVRAPKNFNIGKYKIFQHTHFYLKEKKLTQPLFAEPLQCRTFTHAIATKVAAQLPPILRLVSIRVRFTHTFKFN